MIHYFHVLYLQNHVTLEQLNNVFKFFFRTYRPTEDNSVSFLCNSHWYSEFLIFFELHSLNLLNYSISEFCPVEYLIKKKVREFSLQNKTVVVKRLLIGPAHGGILPQQNNAASIKKHFGLLKDIINIYPETLNHNDEYIENFKKQVFSWNPRPFSMFWLFGLSWAWSVNMHLLPFKLLFQLINLTGLFVSLWDIF